MRNFKCGIIIEEVIRKYCITEYNFEPCNIKVDTFNLIALQNDPQSKQEIAINDEFLDSLCEYENLMITRVQRPLQLSKYYKDLQEKSKDV
jgi:hypothetical protein